MSSTRYLAKFLLYCVIATGCSHLSNPAKDPVGRIDQWLSQQQYGKALRLLEDLDPSHPQYPELKKKKPQVEAEARNYESGILALARRQEKRGEWESARTTLQEGLEQLPDSTPISQALKQHDEKGFNKRAYYDREILIAQGEWLAQANRLWQKRSKYSTVQFMENWKISSLKAEAATVSKKLYNEGMAALERDDLALAQRTLPLALRLYPSDENSNAVKQLNLKVKASKRLQQHQKQLKQGRQRSVLLNQFNQAFNENDLIEARDILARLQSQNLQDQDLALLERDLSEQIEHTVQQLLIEGNGYYSQGKYEQALGSWRKAQQLDPDNRQLKTNIERAETVVKNLEQLKGKQE